MSEFILGVILAGGLGTRMGGGDKPLKEVGGVSILERVIRRLKPQCGGLVLNANGDPARLKNFSLPVIADTIPDYAGPLAGVLAGMRYAQANCPRNALVLSVAGDCPFLPQNLAARLASARIEAQADIAVAASGGWNHPVIALWPVTLAEALEEALRSGLRKIDSWTAGYKTASAEWPVAPYDPFFNANAPEDILAAAEILKARPAA